MEAAPGWGTETPRADADNKMSDGRIQNLEYRDVILSRVPAQRALKDLPEAA